MADDTYEELFKIVLIGDSGVGKTNMMTQYLRKEFNENSKATVGVEFGSKVMEIEGKQVKAQIWDTAGQERYKSITSAYYKGAKGAFVVYDITRKETFESVDKWISDLNHSADKNLIIILVGNKSDLEEQRQVQTVEGEEKAKNKEMCFFETSALNGNNLEKAFEFLLKKVYEKHKSEPENEDNFIEESDVKNLEDIKTEEKKCC